MSTSSEQLRSFLLDTGLVPRTEIERAWKRAHADHTSLGKALILEGALTEDDLRRAEAYVLGIPFAQLKGRTIPFETLSLIPEPIARKHGIVAFKRTATALELAMLDTKDLAVVEFIQKKEGLKILPRLTDKESIKSALLQYQKNLKAEFGDIIETESRTLKAMGEAGETPQDEESLKKLAEDLSVVKIVDTLLNHAVIQGASDIHIEPTESQLVVRYRIDGALHEAMVLPKTALPGISARIKVLARLKLDERRLPQDGRFKLEAEGETVACSVSVIPVYHGEKTVLRILRESVSGFTLEGLGFHGESLERIHHAIKQNKGLVLVTGPADAGKTTTLYTLLDILNRPDVNIATIEDPIEYQMDRVNQTQVKIDIGLTFASGLRALVGQDPDIIMVGEIRDSETASLAVNTALTGHLVLSTLNTKSATATIPRLLEMGIEPFLLASTINAVIAQRLARRLSSEKEQYFLSPAEIKNLKEHINLDRVMKILVQEKVLAPHTAWTDVPFYRPKKNDESQDGYEGRVSIHEVLTISPRVRDLVIQGATAGEIEEQAVKEGMHTILEDGLMKAVRGITSIEEVLRVVSE